MKTLLETLSEILFYAFILALFFVFDGEPDLWDKLHDQAMGSAKPADQVRF